MPLDNTYTWTTNATVVNNSSYTGTPIFVQDAPAGIGSTYSFKTNGYVNTNAGKPNQPSFRLYQPATQTSGTSGSGKTFSCWFKMVPNGALVSGTTSLGPVSYIELFNNTATNNSGNDFLRINYGTYNSTGSGGSDRFIQWNNSEVTVSTSIGGGTSVFTSRKLEMNHWYHIAVVLKDYSPSTLEKAIYVDGQCWHYSITSNKQSQGSNWAWSTSSVRTDTIFGTDTTGGVVDKYLAHYAKWNRALTKEEIRAQAWYGHSNEDYNALVLGDSPTYFAQLDNPDKTTNNSVYGATSWGSLNDDIVGFDVNQQGPSSFKSWKMTPQASANNAYTDTTNSSMMSGLNSLITSGEFSIEFWAKATKPSANRDLIVLNSGNSLNGYFNFRIDNSGRFQLGGASYKSTATTSVSGSMLGTGISTITTETTCNMTPGTGVNNFGDNEWHHIVYTFSKSDSWSAAGSYTGNLYVDGCKVDTRNWTNTYGWLDGTGPLSYLRLGSLLNSASLTNGTASLAALAFYPRRITEIEIGEHFIAGKDYVSRTVKYYDGTTWQTSSGQKVWNGTAWVDWTANRFDGTAWVSI